MPGNHPSQRRNLEKEVMYSRRHFVQRDHHACEVFLDQYQTKRGSPIRKRPKLHGVWFSLRDLWAKRVWRECLEDSRK